MCCKLAGALAVIGSALYMGISVAHIMKKRVGELCELERTVHILKSEIRYHRSSIYEACLATAERCGQPFAAWLNEFCRLLLADRESPGENGNLRELWSKSIEKLYLISSLTKKDIDVVQAICGCLEYPDIEASEQSFSLECENIRGLVKAGEGELNGRMRLAVVLAALLAVLLVVILL